MLKKIILSLSVAASALTVNADEGMWLLTQLQPDREKLMRAEGLQVSANCIADSLSQAIILFNGNGTASFVSEDGLVLTNYHCARTGIQQASSEQHNYLRDGFWADERRAELPLKGITMSINKRVKDVSDEVNRLLKNTPRTREAQYRVINRIADSYAKRYPGTKARIRSCRNNTIHVLYVTLTFNDVRLVGAPPIQIAKFGGETDNWMWPRHDCDFALLRAYVSKDGKPAAYSKDNVPYHPEQYLKISAKGIDEGDYAMSMGYPGYTNRRAISSQIWERRHVFNPPLIKIRTARQDILQRLMRGDEAVNIKYAEKFASSANYCKNYLGMNEWIDRLDLVAKKKTAEKAFLERCTDTDRQLYAQLFYTAEQGVKKASRYRIAQEYYRETFCEACDMVRFVSTFSGAMKSMDRNNFLSNVRIYYKDYSADVDREVMKALIAILVNDLDDDLLTPTLLSLKRKGGKAVDEFVDRLHDSSVFASPEGVIAALDSPKFQLDSDPVYDFSREIDKKTRELYSLAEKESGSSHTATVKVIQAMEKAYVGDFYPDADKSLRLSYGTVQPLMLDDGTIKPSYTTIAGLITKADTSNPDYSVPEKLRLMWQEKDFGCYGSDGDLPTCFVTNGDVTGGNSGSPMLNAKGEVVGLVFDCNWESMLRDFDFDINLHRVICLDTRYLMFIIDRYAGMQNITKELTHSSHQ